MAANIFLKLDGIQGESTDANHKDGIQILSGQWGAHQTGGSAPAGGAGAGKAQLDDFRLTLEYSRASPALLLAALTGKHIKSGVLTVSRPEKQGLNYLTYTFTDVLISSYATDISPDHPSPVDQISIAFGKIEVKYLPQTPTGKPGPPVTAGFDTKANKTIP